jgi:hypothetical protein
MQYTSQIPNVHLQLAELLTLLQTRPEPRARQRAKQIIVTTSIDLMMERAFLQKGLSFTRIVQHRSGQQIDVSQYRVTNVGADQIGLLTASGQVCAVDRADIDELISEHEFESVKVGTEGEAQNRTLLKDLPIKNYHGADSLQISWLSGRSQ